ALDQTRIDRLGNVRAVQLRSQRAGVIARLHAEEYLLHFTVDRRAEGAAETTERGEEGRHDLLAIRAVRGGAKQREAGLVDLGRLAVAERDGRIGKVRVRQNVERVRRRPGQRPEVGEDPLLVLAERMRRPALDVLQVEGVGLQPRFGREKPHHGTWWKAKDFRLDVRRLGAKRREEL